MGKPSGFKEFERQLPDSRTVEERLGDWKEIYRERSLPVIQEQGARCMDCGVPFCQQGCPLGNLIPDWNDAVYRDRWKDAWQRLDSTNNFPEFTGRICPAPCEAACVVAINAEAVTIEQIEKEIVERAFNEGWIQPRPPEQRTSKHVAIVGSGPAGLAAAVQLNRVGHNVTVFEQADRIGGLLRYGIPDFKMEKWVIDRRLEVMEAEGISFRTNTRVGDELPWNELAGAHDAVLIAIGARRPRDLQVPGRELQGVHFAMEFLEKQNRINAGDTIDSAIDVAGKRVVILGGGDTGSDCLGTSLRRGAAHVTQIELLERPPDERAPKNPWPQWPMVFQTSSSHKEGGERLFATLTTRLEGENGKLNTLHGTQVQLGTGPDGRMKIEPCEGTEFEHKVDVLLLAMGFVGPETDKLVEQLGIELDPRGNVKTDDSFATSVPGVYCAGDADRGASLVVWAISEGREAARAIDGALREGESYLPSRGRHQHFGGR